MGCYVHVTVFVSSGGSYGIYDCSPRLLKRQPTNVKFSFLGKRELVVQGLLHNDLYSSEKNVAANPIVDMPFFLTILEQPPYVEQVGDDALRKARIIYFYITQLVGASLKRAPQLRVD